jgi:hypothetical protein
LVSIRYITFLAKVLFESLVKLPSDDEFRIKFNIELKKGEELNPDLKERLDQVILKRKLRYQAILALFLS